MMDKDNFLNTLGQYKTNFEGILSRFTKTRVEIYIKSSDDPVYRQEVLEIIDFFNDNLVDNPYSDRIANLFNEGISNYCQSPSYRSVESIIGVIGAVIIRVSRNPRLLIISNDEGQIHNVNSKLSNKIFIVHGHDEAAKESVARFIEKLGLKAIILHEQADGGKTIIEKFEGCSNVGFTVVLMTPDDVGATKDIQHGSVKLRARQNVLFELGYFIGKIGRGRVCVLYKNGVEIPSDLQGVLYTSMDNGGGWKLKLAKEIKHSGIDIDMNKVV